jgi:ankyrin repeat protein
MHVSVENLMDVLKLSADKFPKTITMKDDYGRTPLHLYCFDDKALPTVLHGQVEPRPSAAPKQEILKFFANNFPANFAVKDGRKDGRGNRGLSGGRTPVHYICENRNVSAENLKDILKLFVNKFPETFTMTDDRDATPIHWYCACQKEVNQDTLKLFADKFHETFTMTDVGGCTLLHLYCRGSGAGEENLKDILKLFLDKVPETFSVTDKEGRTPLHMSCRNDKINAENLNDILKLFEDNFPATFTMNDRHGCTPLHLYVAKHSTVKLDILRLFVDKFPESFTTKNSDGSTPLHLYVKIQEIQKEGLLGWVTRIVAQDIIKLFLDNFPETSSMTDSEGKTPLNYLAERWKSVDWLSVIPSDLEVVKKAIAGDKREMDASWQPELEPEVKDTKAPAVATEPPAQALVVRAAADYQLPAEPNAAAEKAAAEKAVAKKASVEKAAAKAAAEKAAAHKDPPIGSKGKYERSNGQWIHCTVKSCDGEGGIIVDCGNDVFRPVRADQMNTRFRRT